MINRIYHPYWDWEENLFNMWGSVDNREFYLKKAIEFTGDYKIYGESMMKVVSAWGKSCEHNLTNITQNRKAWLGHAACALAFKCPEDIVREAWGNLSTYQQTQANKMADKAIKFWERNHAKNLSRQKLLFS